MHQQQGHRPSIPLTQQHLAIVPAPAKYLVGVYSVRSATRATDAPGFKVCSTIRHFSSTGQRRLCDSLLTSVHLFPKWTLSYVSTSGHLPHQPTLRLRMLTERLQIFEFQAR